MLLSVRIKEAKLDWDNQVKRKLSISKYAFDCWDRVKILLGDLYEETNNIFLLFGNSISTHKDSKILSLKRDN